MFYLHIRTQVAQSWTITTVASQWPLLMHILCFQHPLVATSANGHLIFCKSEIYAGVTIRHPPWSKPPPPWRRLWFMRWGRERPLQGLQRRNRIGEGTADDALKSLLMCGKRVWTARKCSGLLAEGRMSWCRIAPKWPMWAGLLGL